MNLFKNIYDWLFKPTKMLRFNILSDGYNLGIARFKHVYGNIYASHKIAGITFLIKLNTKKLIAVIIRDDNGYIDRFDYLKYKWYRIGGFTFFGKLNRKYNNKKFLKQLAQYLNGKINKVTYKPKKIRRRYIRYAF